MVKKIFAHKRLGREMCWTWYAVWISCCVTCKELTLL